jgi:hypothetical protein
MECNFCKSILKTISSLNYHMKNNKKCLDIQLQTVGEVNSNLIECEYCNKSFTNIKKHLNICKEKNKVSIEKNKDDYEKLLNEKEQIITKFKKENQELKEYIIKLETENKIYKKSHETVDVLAKQPKISHMNTNNKILSIQSHLDFSNTEHIKQLIDEKYDKKYLFQGQKGVAQFAVDYILKDDTGQLKYVCTDPSRQIFKYKDSEGYIKKDIEAKKLTGFLVNSGIQEKTHDVAIDFWTDENGDVDGEKCSVLLEPAQSVKNIKNDNATFKKELVNMTTI